MTASWQPASAPELAEALAQASNARKTIEIQGGCSKRRLGGPHRPADVAISTRALNRVIEYEPNDLTVSVEAGMPWAQFQSMLAEHRQMVPLDPPWSDTATVGGVAAANTCGPRRRLYGSVRDVVIGMKFATLEGKIVQTGGMVVKNVAGLDMGKLMIGSFGTLAAIVSVNFKVSPQPPATRTFAFSFRSLAEAASKRNEILTGVLQPAAIDLFNPHAAGRLGREGWTLLLGAAGSPAVIDRYTRELAGAEAIDGEAEQKLWAAVREFIPHFLAEHEHGAVARVSSTLQELPHVLEHAPVPVMARSGNGISYACFSDPDAAIHWLKQAVGRGWRGVIESAPPLSCRAEEQWPQPGNDLEPMQRIKRLFDPNNLLNHGRLYGRI